MDQSISAFSDNLVQKLRGTSELCDLQLLLRLIEQRDEVETYSSCFSIRNSLAELRPENVQVLAMTSSLDADCSLDSSFL